MALNGSGPISLGGATAGQSIALELGLSTTGTISLNQSNVRTLANVPSGTIIMPTNFYGKANAFVVNVTLSSNTAEYNMKSAAIAAGWNQTDVLDMTVTINSGVSVYANSTSNVAFVTGSTFPTGTSLKLINNGTIVGRGGNGGNGGYANTVNGGGGSSGGAGLTASYALRITNNNIIAGGGGGGGGGAGYNIYNTGTKNYNYYGGSGGGGGIGISSGGASGGSNGVAGGNGTLTAAGNGGSSNASGGGGGGFGAAGSSGSSAGGDASSSPGAGGAGGNCTTSGSNANITWIATGTRYGTIA